MVHEHAIEAFHTIFSVQYTPNRGNRGIHVISTLRVKSKHSITNRTLAATCMGTCYCILGREEITAGLARGPRARNSINFRKFSPCIARARRTRAGLTVHPPSRTLELLAFNEYCRFDTSARAGRIKRGSLYTPRASRSIKTAIFIES